MLNWIEIFFYTLYQFIPVWVGMIVIYTFSIFYKNKLGLYGKLFDSKVGAIGFGIVIFWILTAIFAELIITNDPLQQISGMKNKVPGTPIRGTENEWYLLGEIN